MTKTKAKRKPGVRSTRLLGHDEPPADFGKMEIALPQLPPLLASIFSKPIDPNERLPEKL